MSEDSGLPWVSGHTIGEVLNIIANKFPENDSLVFPQLEYKISYRELDKLVDSVAKGLLAIGLKKGQHIGVWSTNLPQWPLLQMASARIGVVLVTINPAYRSHELAFVIGHSDISALFITDEFKSSNYFEILSEACPGIESRWGDVLNLETYPRLKHIISLKSKHPAGMMNWEQMLKLGDKISDSQITEISKTLKPTDAINIQYTSGTTGFPKAATLTHRNILTNAYYVTGCQNISEKDRMCIPVPYYHCFGCVMGTLGALTRGAAMVIPAEYFDPLQTLRAIEKEKATTVYGVPTMFIAMLEHPEFQKFNLKSLRSGIMAGSPCPIEVMKKCVDLMGVREITIAYGQTETSPVLTQTRIDDPLEVRVETVGRPLPGVEVKIVDPHTGMELGDDMPGELCARGHGTMIGYYKNSEGTQNAIDEEGFVHTGDLAIRRKGGHYRITGRIKDMVIRGGENIYPLEIEEYIFTHPDVEQVSVFGVPDEKMGEELCAWVKLKSGTKLGEEDIKTYCKGQIAHFKVPRYVKFVDSFPQTVTGKLQKFKMREIMSAELGLKEKETA